MKKHLFVIIFYIFLGLSASFPIIVNCSGQIYGDSSDPVATVWHFWWLSYAKTHDLSRLVIPIIAAPFGVDLSLSPGHPFWEYINTLLTLHLGAVAAYNLQILLSFILSGLFMYYFIFLIIKDKKIALLMGMIFTLSPYHFARAFEHLGLSNMQWMVLYIMSLFNLRKEITYKNAVLCGLCFSIIGWFDFYYLYFMMIFTVIFILFSFFYYREAFKNLNTKKITVILTGIFIFVLLLFPSIFYILKISFFAQKAKTLVAFAYERPFHHLFADSSRVLNYFLPAEFHPFLGGITRPLIGTLFYGSTPHEQTLYLGYVGLILALIGHRSWRRKRANLKAEYKKSEENFVISFFTLSLFIFFVSSFPPYVQIGKIFIPFPSFFLYKVFPMFRNYARMGVLVLISVCVLASFGLKEVLNSIVRRSKKILMCIFLAVLICLEFLPYPPLRTTDVTKIPPAYEWLKKQSGNFTIAEYPLNADDRKYLFFQSIHQKKLVNGAIPGTYAYEVMQKIIGLEDPATAGILSFLGAKYVFVHKDRYRAYEGGKILGQVPDLSSDKRYELVKSFKNVDVYSINAAKINPDTVTVTIVQKKIQNTVSPKQIGSDEVQQSWEYDVKLFNKISLASGSINIGNEIRYNNKTVIPIVAKFKVVPWLSTIVEAEATLNSFVDKKQSATIRYDEKFIVNKKARQKEALFDQKQHIMTTKDRKVKIEPGAQDPLSLLYFLSKQDFNINKEFTLFVNPGKSNYQLNIQVIDKETIKVGDEEYTCWKLASELFKIKDKNKKILSMNLWLEDSKEQKPVKIKAITKMGFIDINLINNNKED